MSAPFGNQQIVRSSAFLVHSTLIRGVDPGCALILHTSSRKMIETLRSEGIQHRANGLTTYEDDTWSPA